jgi:protein-S-isoprenylcysteine O-methyltransferase Ste14
MISMAPIVALVIGAFWLLLEAVRIRREDRHDAKNHDKNSAKLWDIANGLQLIGIVFGFTQIGRIAAGNILGIIGLGLLIAGVVIRWTAIYQLGKYFTGIVLVKNDQRLIRTGIYKYIRHPSYAGALIGHAGLGLSFSNWICVGFSVVPFLIAAFYRMHVEDKALHDAFGAEYLDYSRTAKRLIPKIY